MKTATAVAATARTAVATAVAATAAVATATVATLVITDDPAQADEQRFFRWGISRCQKKLSSGGPVD
jgi:hypothetical protein